MVVHIGRKRVPGFLVLAGPLRGVGRRVGIRVPGCCWGPDMIKRHPEPLLWMLFSAGGVLSAMLMPILVLLFGVAFPLGWLTAPLTRADARRARQSA